MAVKGGKDDVRTIEGKANARGVTKFAHVEFPNPCKVGAQTPVHVSDGDQWYAVSTLDEYI